MMSKLAFIAALWRAYQKVQPWLDKPWVKTALAGAKKAIGWVAGLFKAKPGDDTARPPTVPGRTAERKNEVRDITDPDELRNV